MFKYYNALLTRSGDALAGYFVRLFDSSGNQVTIYADENETAISTESGVANAAKSDLDGMVRFFVPSGDYDIRLYDPSDNFISTERAVPMVKGISELALEGDDGATKVGTSESVTVQAALDARAKTADLASTDTDKGAALVAFKQGSVSAVDRTLLAKARESVSVTDFGAKGDGITDDTAAINAAIKFVADSGGGDVRVPKGHYITSDNIRLLDGVYLVGEGRGSWLDNIATSGFSKCTVVSGNLGDITAGNGLFGEATYNIEAVAPGDKQVTLVTAGDAATFQVGDIVGIASYEKWPQAFPDNFEKYTNLNEVTDIAGGVISLRYGLPDALSDSSGNPTIRRISGTFNGYDGLPLWASKNCGASNLRVTQSTGLTSGWYAIFPCGVNQRYENIWMDDVSTLFGTNGLSYSTVRNVQGRFEAGFVDFCDWQHSNLLENIHATRFADNAALNRLGFAVNNGADVTVRNCSGDLGGYGRFGLYKVHRGVFERCQVTDPGSAEAMLLGYGDKNEAFANKLTNPFQHGIVIYGEGHKVHSNRIPAVGASGFSAYAASGISVGYVHDNIFGIEGSETSGDRLYQNGGLSANMLVWNNTGYVEGLTKQGRANWAGFASTNQTGSYATLKTANIKGTSGVVRGLRVKASGLRTGTTSTKTLRLKLGSTVLGQINYGASDTGAWSITSEITVRTSNNDAAISTLSVMGSAVANTFQIVANGLVSDTTITVEGQVANAADSVAIYQFIVEPIVEQLS